MVLLLLCTLLLGCAAHRTGDAVRSISFAVEGRKFPKALVGSTSNRALRGEMGQRVSSWQSLTFPGAIDPEWLERRRLDGDGEALERWFVVHGYLDAKFLRWEVARHGREGRRMHPVSVRGFVSAGVPSRIRTVTITGIDHLRPAMNRSLRSRAAVSPGRIFSSVDYTATIKALKDTLLRAGYAFVDVQGAVEAFPAQHAVDVVIHVETGRIGRFGPIRIDGVTGVPKNIVADAVTFQEGDPFSPRDLADTRTALFGLRVFSVVNVSPSLADPESGIVPVRIEVKGTKWHRIKLGPGIEVESGKATLYGAAEWEDSNLFHRLWRFTQTAKLGIAGVVAQDTNYQTFNLSQVTLGPMVDLGSALTIPHAIGPAWSVDVNGRIQVGIETGYRFFSPELAPGLTWHPMIRHGRDVLSVGLDYRIRYFNYFDFTVDIQDIADSPLGLDLTNPFLLSMLDQHVTWDSRDSPLSPTRGWYGSLALAEAGGPVFGNFNFVRAQAELRTYRSLPTLGHWDPRTVIAARLGGGVIAPYGSGPRASVPYAERLYLGGGTTVRGWGADRLGPSVATTDAATGETVLVPAGGLFDNFGNLEVRKAVAGGISVAAFTDVGRVWPTMADASFGGLQWTLGGGLRYATVVGPIRGDVGVRMSPDTPDLPALPRWTVHFGLAEAF